MTSHTDKTSNEKKSEWKCLYYPNKSRQKKKFESKPRKFWPQKGLFSWNTLIQAVEAKI